MPSGCATREPRHESRQRMNAGAKAGRWCAERRILAQLKLRHASGKLISTDARVEIAEVVWQGYPTRDRGWLLTQALTVHPLGGMALVARIAYARTGSYAARFYIPEHDHNGSGGFVMLYGSGVRFYLFLRVELAGRLRLSAKYASSFVDPPPGPDHPPGERIRSVMVSLQLEGSW